jgi:hypothetical protein
MKPYIRIIIAAAFAGVPISVMAAEAAPLQFTDLGGIKTWKAGGDTTVFVKSKSDQWYRADMLETCMKYDTAKGVNFITELDPETNKKVSKVIVERRICQVTSLKKVDSPDAK